MLKSLCSRNRPKCLLVLLLSLFQEIIWNAYYSIRLKIRYLQKRTKFQNKNWLTLLCYVVRMVLVRWKKCGCVSSSRDIDRLNKAFQATKYVQNSGSIYLLTRSAPRYSAKAWVSFLATYKRPLPAEKAVKAFQGFSPLFSGRIQYSGWRLVECRSQTRKLVLSFLRAGWNNGTAAGLKYLYMNVVLFIMIGSVPQ